MSGRALCMVMFTFSMSLPLRTASLLPSSSYLYTVMAALISSLIVILTLLPLGALADNGMDMSMDGSMSLTSSSMVAYLHFKPGDTLWFLGWVPESKGAVLGACIGLFLLGLVDRWLGAVRATAERAWRQRAQIVMTNRLNEAAKTNPGTVVRPTMRNLMTLRSVPPFIPSQDIARGLIHGAQVALGFAFMLAVMTFQAAFIISIVIGLGVGEMLFGRYIAAASVH